jgi:hypothetical protein
MPASLPILPRILPNKPHRNSPAIHHPGCRRDKIEPPDASLAGLVWMESVTPGGKVFDLQRPRTTFAEVAAIFAVRAGRQIIESGDFAEARDPILLGRRTAPRSRRCPRYHCVRSIGVISAAAIAGTPSSLRRSRSMFPGRSAPSTGTTWASTSRCLGPM